MGRIFTSCVVLILALVGTLYAQGASAEGETSPVSPTANAPAPQGRHDPEIDRLLKALTGTWSITEELSPDAAHPNGVTGRGTVIWRPGPGASSVIEEYRSRLGDEDISGLGALWWDPAAHGYHTIWCDSTNPGGCIDFKNAARWEGQVLVLQEDYEVRGKKLTFREEFSDITPDGFTQTLYGGEAGGKLKVDDVIRAKKPKADK